MRIPGLRTAIASACAIVALSGQAAAQRSDDWIVQGEALARRIEAGNLIVTDHTRADRLLAARLAGELMLLYWRCWFKNSQNRHATHGGQGNRAQRARGHAREKSFDLPPPARGGVHN